MIAGFGDQSPKVSDGHRRVAISISAVKTIDAGIRLSLTKDEVRDLQPLNLDLPA
jgi:hypothetical protein